MTALRKFRYEFPIMEPHFVQAPHGASVVAFVKRTYPHNYDEVLPTIVEIPRFPEFWRTLDEHGRALPPDRGGGS